ncbi:MAG TPA: N-formylglutamate amidohydrolase, partial [Erythrobacter sp.]|nr:N-formylglutamate amidohydrolase [Erythrobacter sp.]
GIDPALLDAHIAVDIGVEGIADRLARRHGMPAHIATVSRLVCDLHRREDDPAAVPSESDGTLIPGNIGANVEARLDRFHRPYHAALAELIARAQPRLILALHSFTPKMATSDEQRPWEVALLYNQDDRAARHAIRLFGEQGLNVGDNQPYSGKQLNATMDR